MTDTTTTPEGARDAGWIPCRRCKGTGEFSWAEGKSGPCFLCNGTGDGRVQNYAGFGPRRPGGKRGKGNGWKAIPGTGLPEGILPAGGPAGGQDEPEESLPAVTPQHMTAAEHLAAALAGLQGSAPVDADMVRQILATEMGDSIAKLERLIDSAVSTRALLTEAIAGIPRRLVITVGDHMGELPEIRHPMAEHLAMFVAANIPVMLVGPAGSGKTTAAHQVATALGLSFYLMAGASGPHEILGYVDAHGRYQTTPFRQAYEHGGELLWDEVDTSDPTALTVANAGLANGHMAFPDRPEPVVRHPDFRMVAAANTYGNGADRVYVGRNQLDGATLDRFATLDWDYDESLERALAGNDDWTGFVQSVRRAVGTLKMRHIVSPRASINGAKMLAAGMARSMVESALVWKGLSDADRARVRGAL